MIKLSYCIPADKQNLNFQQQSVFGRIHTRDYAFYMRKFAFMQQQQKPNADKKTETHLNNNG